MKTKFLIFILMLCNVFLCAQDYNAKAIISKDTAFIGDILKLDIVVNSSTNPLEAIISSNESWSIKKLSNFTPIEGAENTYSASYQFVPLLAGELKIPSFIIKDEAQEIYITQPLKLSIEQPELSDSMQLSVDYKPKRIFIGQKITLHYLWKTLYPLNTIKSVNLSIPSFEDKNFKTYPSQYYINPQDEKAVGMPIQDQRIIGKAEIMDFDGTRKCYALSFETIVVPQNAGKFTLEAPTLICAVPKERDVSKNPTPRVFTRQFLYPSYFDNEFFNYQAETSTLKKQFVKGNSIELEVAPLPLENMPDDFSYIIGEYTISAKTPERNVRVGDTLDFNITIEALNASSLEGISLNEKNFSAVGFDKFEVSPSPLGTIQANKITLNIKLLVRSIESTKIPQVSFSFFNPNTEEYVSLHTEEIDLMVTPSQSARLINEDGSEVLIKTNLTKNRAGIYDTEVGDGFFSPSPKVFIGNMTFLEFLALALITPIIFFSIFFTKLIKKIILHSSSFRDRLAFSLRLRSISLKSKITAKQIEEIIQELFSLYIEDEKASVTFIEIESFLKQRQCPVELQSKLAEVFEQLRSDLYAQNKSQKANKDLLKKTIKLLKNINKNLK